MSRVELLTLAERKELFAKYHEFLVSCKEKQQTPILKDFLDDLVRRKPFSKFTSKNIANRLEQERLSDGKVLWPKIVDLRNDINNYQPPSLENHIKLFLGNLKSSIDSYDLLSSSNSKVIKEMLSVLATEILNMPLSDKEIEIIGREKEILTLLLEYYPNIIGEIEKLSPEKSYSQIKSIFSTNFSKYSNLIEDLLKSKITEYDIQAIAYRKQQLTEFEKLLNDPDYFNSILIENVKLTNESLWQKYFEKNKWIFGYSLNYIFTTSLNDKKLEQIVSGHDFNNSGKRVDGLLKTKGVISSLCFVEIKTHKDILLKDKQYGYRADCWQISDPLSGAVAQIQKTVHKAKQLQKSKFELTTKSGDPTGEEIFLVEPKSFILIGHLKEFLTRHGVNQEKYKSFEIFRRNLINPEIITFDELYERAKYIVEQQS